MLAGGRQERCRDRRASPHLSRYSNRRGYTLEDSSGRLTMRVHLTGHLRWPKRAPDDGFPCARSVHAGSGSSRSICPTRLPSRARQRSRTPPIEIFPRPTSFSASVYCRETGISGVPDPGLHTLRKALVAASRSATCMQPEPHSMSRGIGGLTHPAYFRPPTQRRAAQDIPPISSGHDDDFRARPSRVVDATQLNREARQHHPASSEAGIIAAAHFAAS